MFQFQTLLILDMYVVRTREDIFSLLRNPAFQLLDLRLRHKDQEIMGQSDNKIKESDVKDAEIAAIAGPCWKCDVPGHP